MSNVMRCLENFIVKLSGMLLTHALTMFTDETIVLDDVEPGQPCAVLSTLNGGESQWYRGQIISRTSDAVEDFAVSACMPIKVYLVDIGQTARVLSLHIKLLQQQFFILPAQAISVTVSVNSIGEFTF
jgi:Tudor domain